MKIQEVFDKPKPFLFVVHDKPRGYMFTAIEIDRPSGLLAGGTFQVWEIHIGTPDAQHWQEFEPEIVIANLSRLSQKYLAFAKNYCEERLKEEYSDYLNNHEEYEMWVETLEKLKVEIQERSEK